MRWPMFQVLPILIAAAIAAQYEVDTVLLALLLRESVLLLAGHVLQRNPVKIARSLVPFGVRLVNPCTAICPLRDSGPACCADLRLGLSCIQSGYLNHEEAFLSGTKMTAPHIQAD